MDEKAQYPFERSCDQGYRIHIEASNHIVSTTFVGVDSHSAIISLGLDDDGEELLEQFDEIVKTVRDSFPVAQYGCQDGCENPFRMKREPEMCPFCGGDIKEYDEWIQS